MLQPGLHQPGRRLCFLDYQYYNVLEDDEDFANSEAAVHGFDTNFLDDLDEYTGFEDMEPKDDKRLERSNDHFSDMLNSEKKLTKGFSAWGPLNLDFGSTSYSRRIHIIFRTSKEDSSIQNSYFIIFGVVLILVTCFINSSLIINHCLYRKEKRLLKRYGSVLSKPNNRKLFDKIGCSIFSHDSSDHNEELVNIVVKPPELKL